MHCFTKLWKIFIHQDIELVTIGERRDYLVAEPNYHSTKYFSEKLLAIEMRKAKVEVNKQCK